MDDELRLPDKTKREQRGCESDSKDIAYEWDPDLRRCPKSQLTPEVMHILGWRRDWRMFQGLPFPGEWGAQPAYVCDALRLCVDADAEVDDELARKPRGE